MARYKITCVYSVEAKSRIEARDLWVRMRQSNKEDEYLDYIGIQEGTGTQKTGWIAALTEQRLPTPTTKPKRA
jgi:hypothetical protein